MVKIYAILLMALLTTAAIGCGGGGGSGGGSPSQSTPGTHTEAPAPTTIDSVSYAPPTDPGPITMVHNPEPSSLALLGMGVAGLAVALWRKRQKKV